ncbi:hypothetical protein PMAYCL1PPCAC_31100, partial [Pristionchus mayeri]
GEQLVFEEGVLLALGAPTALILACYRIPLGTVVVEELLPLLHLLDRLEEETVFRTCPALVRDVQHPTVAANVLVIGDAGQSLQLLQLRISIDSSSIVVDEEVCIRSIAPVQFLLRPLDSIVVGDDCLRPESTAGEETRTSPRDGRRLHKDPICVSPSVGPRPAASVLELTERRPGHH